MNVWVPDISISVTFMAYDYFIARYKYSSVRKNHLLACDCSRVRYKYFSRSKKHLIGIYLIAMGKGPSPGPTTMLLGLTRLHSESRHLLDVDLLGMKFLCLVKQWLSLLPGFKPNMVIQFITCVQRCKCYLFQFTLWLFLNYIT